MPELNDYSGEFKPDLRFEDLSKDALLRLARTYAKLFNGIGGIFNTVNRKSMSIEEAFEKDLEVYEILLKKFNAPLIMECMNITGNDVVTMLKVFQLSPDGLDVIIPEFDIKNNNHAILTFTQCPMLFYFEKHKDDRAIKALCGRNGIEERTFNAYCRYFNPDMKVKALKLPPRETKDDICCQWEFKIEPKAEI
jgi:hypothetical protein